MMIQLVLIVLSVTAVIVRADFEDTRCRCVCPSTKGYRLNGTSADDNRRYYTRTNIMAGNCDSHNVVKPNVESIVDATKMDAFLANCDCKFESRNTVMLKVVVIFVICVLMVLVTYMLFLMCLDPMLRRQPNSIPYRQHNDQMEENIFARSANESDHVSGAGGGVSTSSSDGTQIRTRNPPSNSVLERVEAEQNKWMRKVEEQRRAIFTDHTMLN